jgi:hypothetical protein
VRRGLTAETVIGALEDADDYRAFEAAITADYDVQSAIERELVLRLVSLPRHPFRPNQGRRLWPLTKFVDPGMQTGGELCDDPMKVNSVGVPRP